MRAVFEDSATDAILFVDAVNAFNNLNRKTALFNIRHICPSISTILINCYRESTYLFGEGLFSHRKRGQLGATRWPWPCLPRPQFRSYTRSLLLVPRKRGSPMAQPPAGSYDASATGGISCQPTVQSTANTQTQSKPTRWPRERNLKRPEPFSQKPGCKLPMKVSAISEVP